VGKTEYHTAIIKSLKKIGFKNILLASDIYEYHYSHPPEQLKEQGFDYYLQNQNQIIDALRLFNEEQSREIFTAVMKTHMLRTPYKIPRRKLEEQYFPQDIMLNKGYKRIINCGAYDGDTVIQSNALNGKIEALVCFEPDAKNFSLLQEYLNREQDNIAENIIAFPCGVFSHETQVCFVSGNAFNCMISEEGKSFIQCVAIDHVIPGFNPTFINMDVEGVEFEVIKGAKKTICDSKPDLAICVYHAPNHIWDIPLYLDRLNLGYKFYLRNYTSFIGETVLYATV
jgi:FkbM family methyltransferase